MEPTKNQKLEELTPFDLDRIVEMAWEDRTSFEAIYVQFGATESNVIKLMRQQLKQSSFKLWRARVQGRTTKHAQLRNADVSRFKCTLQKQITLNKMSKR